MKQIIYSLLALLMMNSSLMAQYTEEFTTELTGINGGFDDILEVNNCYYALGKGSDAIHYAKFNIDGDLIWS